MSVHSACDKQKPPEMNCKFLQYARSSKIFLQKQPHETIERSCAIQENTSICSRDGPATTEHKPQGQAASLSCHVPPQ